MCHLMILPNLVLGGAASLFYTFSKVSSREFFRQLWRGRRAFRSKWIFSSIDNEGTSVVPETPLY